MSTEADDGEPNHSKGMVSHFALQSFGQDPLALEGVLASAADVEIYAEVPHGVVLARRCHCGRLISG